MIYISVFTGGVDFSKAGTYNIKIYAEDESGNKAVKKCKLVIENDNESLKQQAGNGKASWQTDGFLNSFKDEETANEIGKADVQHIRLWIQDLAVIVCCLEIQQTNTNRIQSSHCVGFSYTR